MSNDKQDNIKKGPMFKLDPETGKYVPLPCKWLLPRVASTSEKERVASSSKKKLDIRPLKLTDLDWEDSPSRAAKMRKTDSVRKGLFNAPPTKIGRPSAVRRSMTRRSTAAKKTEPKKNRFELSPLLDMEEVEEELLSKKRFLKGYPFRSPGRPSIKFTKETKPKPSPLAKKPKLERKNTPKKVTTKAPESPSSNDAEFLEFEKECRADEPDKENKSPISAVCNLLEDTVLNSAKKNKPRSTNNIDRAISDLENILDDNRKAFELYTINYEENLARMTELLENTKTNHENFLRLEEANRRKISDIIADLKGTPHELESKPDDSPSKPKLIVSPVIMKSADLRRTTLMRNLVAKSQQQHTECPRIRKALDMYNSLRHDISILATPKLDRRALMESPRSSNLSALLSRRVQSQCLLLQDTPVRRN